MERFFVLFTNSHLFQIIRYSKAFLSTVISWKIYHMKNTEQIFSQGNFRAANVFCAKCLSQCHCFSYPILMSPPHPPDKYVLVIKAC